MKRKDLKVKFSFRTWLSCSSDRRFGSWGLRLCTTETLKINKTAERFSFKQRAQKAAFILLALDQGSATSLAPLQWLPWDF